MDRARDVRKFLRASSQRLTAAGCLLEHGFHLESIYIAGYAVECALKGLILQRTPKARYPETWHQLTGVGAKGHDFEYLKYLLKVRRCIMDTDAVESFHRVASWSTDLRYEVGLKEYDEAERFLSAAKAVCRWCREK